MSLCTLRVVSKKQREIAELEAEVKLAGLLKRQAALLDQ
jgi:hypothetical protein